MLVELLVDVAENVPVLVGVAEGVLVELCTVLVGVEVLGFTITGI